MSTVNLGAVIGTAAAVGAEAMRAILGGVMAAGASRKAGDQAPGYYHR